MLKPHDALSASNRLINNRLMRLTLLFFFFPLLFPACLKDKFDDVKVDYHGSFAVPVAQVSFTLADVLEDDTLLTVDADNSIRLIYREDEFITLSAQDLLDELTNDFQQTLQQSSAIGTVAIEDVRAEFETPFSEFVDDFENAALKQMLQQNDGSSVVVPAFSEDVADDSDVPGLTDFTFMEIENGLLGLTVTNSLFVPLEDFTVEIYDNTYNNSVGVLVYDQLAVDGVYTEYLDLQGKTISNNLKIIAGKLNSPGAGGSPVLIDLDKTLRFQLAIEGVTVESGQVKIPAGVLAESDWAFNFTMNNGEQLKKLTLDHANVTYSILSDIKATVKLKLTFPSVLRNGQPVSQEILIEPTSPNAPKTGTLNFDNTAWLLDQDASQPFNRLVATYELSLAGSSNSQLAFEAADKVAIAFTVSGLTVSDASGYFGFREEIIEEKRMNLGFDFSDFAQGSSPVIFSDPKLKLEIANSFGIPLSANFDAWSVGATGMQANLTPPKVSIQYPSQAEAGRTANTVYVLDKTNSNLAGLLSVYPEDILYAGTVSINAGNNGAIQNFLRADSKLIASAEMDLPLRFKAQEIVWRDTINAFDLDLEEGLTVDDIREAALKILYRNGFPAKANAKIIALSAGGLETILADNLVLESAKVDEQGRVWNSDRKQGEVSVVLPKDKIRLLDDAEKIIFEVRVQTANGGQTPVVLCTHYGIELKTGMTVSFE
jgi:hypothetical protein